MRKIRRSFDGLMEWGYVHLILFFNIHNNRYLAIFFATTQRIVRFPYTQQFAFFPDEVTLEALGSGNK